MTDIHSGRLYLFEQQMKQDKGMQEQNNCMVLD